MNKQEILYAVRDDLVRGGVSAEDITQREQSLWIESGRVTVRIEGGDDGTTSHHRVVVRCIDVPGMARRYQWSAPMVWSYERAADYVQECIRNMELNAQRLARKKAQESEDVDLARFLSESLSQIPLVESKLCGHCIELRLDPGASELRFALRVQGGKVHLEMPVLPAVDPLRVPGIMRAMAALQAALSGEGCARCGQRLDPRVTAYTGAGWALCCSRECAESYLPKRYS